MPRKMARPAVSTAVWARGMAAAVSTPRRYCRKAVIARIFMPDRKPSGESRIKRMQHENRQSGQNVRPSQAPKLTGSSLAD
jgi:hypothetical protein